MSDAVSSDGGVSADVPAPAAPAEVAPVETPAPAVEAATIAPEPEIEILTEQPAAVPSPTPPAEPRAPEPVPPPPPPPQPIPDTSIKSRLSQAFEALRFRKRAKLDKVLALAAKKGRIKNNDVEKLLRVSDATASRYLAQLVKE